MPTKGAGNRYGNTNHGKMGKATQHTNFAWAKDFNKHSLAQHFRDHGEQMGCKTQNAYAAHAVSFANYVDRYNCTSFIDKNGSTYKYNKATNTLAIITKSGYVITYYKPKDGYEYYKKQKREKDKYGKK